MSKNKSPKRPISKLSNNLESSKPVKKSRNEVQSHGFIWEKMILKDVFKLSDEQIESIKYTSKHDIPSHLNTISKCHISIKTTGRKNSICMGSSLDFFDAINSNEPINMIVINYNQSEELKKIVGISVINLESSKEILFGKITRKDIEKLNTAVKSVKCNEKPTIKQRAKMYKIRDSLHQKNIDIPIRFRIKCNSTQSRIQCEFNNFSKFIKNNNRVITNTENSKDVNILYENRISSEIYSSSRNLKKK